jgi:hypothetical protein
VSWLNPDKVACSLSLTVKLYVTYPETNVTNSEILHVCSSLTPSPAWFKLTVQLLAGC